MKEVKNSQSSHNTTVYLLLSISSYKKKLLQNLSKLFFLKFQSKSIQTKRTKCKNAKQKDKFVSQNRKILLIPRNKKEKKS